MGGRWPNQTESRNAKLTTAGVGAAVRLFPLDDARVLRPYLGAGTDLQVLFHEGIIPTFLLHGSVGIAVRIPRSEAEFTVYAGSELSYTFDWKNVPGLRLGLGLEL